MNIELNTDWIKKHHQMIHFFGLGFIQIKMDQETRLHFYNVELPSIMSDEEIHNHRYDFASSVLKGTFTQQIWEPIAGDDHLREFESCQEGVKAEGEPTRCGVRMVSSHAYDAGSHYWISHEVFHRVYASNCITKLTRSGYKKTFAEVIRPVESTADKICPFSSKIETEKLWQIVDSMVK